MFFVLSAYAQETEGLRDIQPPIEIHGNIFLIFFLLAVLLLMGLIGAFWFFFLRKKAAPPQKIYVKLPHELAYERLEELKRQDFFSQGKIKEHYTVLSDIVRRYLEAQFQINAPEMTSEEFLWSLNASASFVSRHKDLLKEFLNSCDLVKFAKYGPTAKESERSFDLAKDLIDATIPIKETTEAE